MTLRNRSAYLRPLFDTAPEGVAHHAFQGAGLGLLHELVIDVVQLAFGWLVSKSACG